METGVQARLKNATSSERLFESSLSINWLVFFQKKILLSSFFVIQVPVIGILSSCCNLQSCRRVLLIWSIGSLDIVYFCQRNFCIKEVILFPIDSHQVIMVNELRSEMSLDINPQTHQFCHRH